MIFVSDLYFFFILTIKTWFSRVFVESVFQTPLMEDDIVKLKNVRRPLRKCDTLNYIVVISYPLGNLRIRFRGATECSRKKVIFFRSIAHPKLHKKYNNNRNIFLYTEKDVRS